MSERSSFNAGVTAIDGTEQAHDLGLGYAGARGAGCRGIAAMKREVDRSEQRPFTPGRQEQDLLAVGRTGTADPHSEGAIARERAAQHDVRGATRGWRSPEAGAAEPPGPGSGAVQHHPGADLELASVDVIDGAHAPHPTRTERNPIQCLDVIGDLGARIRGALHQAENDAFRGNHLGVGPGGGSRGLREVEIGEPFAQRLRAEQPARRHASILPNPAIATEARHAVQPERRGQSGLASEAEAAGRKHELERSNQVRRQAQQLATFVNRREDALQIQLLQVAKATVDRLEAVPGRPRAKVVALDQRDGEASESRVAGGCRSVDPPPDDDQIVFFAQEIRDVSLHRALIGPAANALNGRISRRLPRRSGSASRRGLGSFLEEGVEVRTRFRGCRRRSPAARAGRKIVAAVGALPLPHPFRRGFATLVVGAGVVKLAVPTNVEVCVALVTNVAEADALACGQLDRVVARETSHDPKP